MIPNLGNLARTPLVDERKHIDHTWLLFLNSLSKQTFNVISTASGNVSQALPDARSAFGGEFIYLKSTNDVHTLTVTGAVTGNVVLSSQGDSARFKSDGTNWWKV